jgi:uncharacterized NAD(P)/FAD-binding protein YdhS
VGLPGRSRRFGAGPLAITVVEPRARLGRGIAFSTPEPGHLMSGPARALSLYPEAPMHFVRWLQREATSGGWRPATGVSWEAAQPLRWHFRPVQLRALRRRGSRRGRSEAALQESIGFIHRRL